MTPRLVTATAIEPTLPAAITPRRSRAAALLPVGFAVLTSLQVVAAVLSLSHLLR